jgi:hypothetical protein
LIALFLSAILFFPQVTQDDVVTRFAGYVFIVSIVWSYFVGIVADKKSAAQPSHQGDVATERRENS